MPRLKEKTAVITGASTGIGSKMALAFAREGAHVIVNYNHSADDADTITNRIKAEGGQAKAIQADVSDEKDIHHLIEAAQNEMGKIDIWVNNAGADILTGAGAELSDQQKIQSLTKIDLMGTIHCCWALAPIMKAQGSGVIINMAWDLASHGFAGRNPEMFAAVKSGVLGFSRSFARSNGPEIRVNILAPGWIETAFAETVMADEYFEARIGEIPLRRFGKPEEVAEVAVFLASDDASYMTGEMIKINGGLI